MTRLYKKLVFIIILLLILCSSSFVSAEPASITIEGTGNHFVTGESYPSMIILSGFDAEHNRIYFNFNLITTKTNPVPSSIKYYIEVYNNNSVLIGNLGTFTEPISVNLQGQSAAVINKEIQLFGTLTSRYNVIITVKEAI